MATAQLGTLLRHIQKSTAGHCARQWTDGQLLDDFAALRSEAAFTALVSRHGAMVLRVCRRVLNHEQDAEDAFQATFLVLARNTGSIRKREAVASWLHGVAYRTAMKAKRSAARRRNHEARLRAVGPPAAAGPTWDDVQAVLDEEVQQLSPCFREAFVLCVLQGKSGAEAAAELGCKEGTVKSRVNRARQSLQRQLAGRGIKLTALLAALSVAESAGRAALPATLARTTVRLGPLVAAGEPAAGTIPSHVAALAAGVTRAMFNRKLKVATAVLLAVGLVATGAGVLARQALAAGERQAGTPQSTAGDPKAGPAAAQPAAADEKADGVEVRGHVLDPDGKPIRGAKLLFLDGWARKAPAKVSATSSADGQFLFTVPRPRVANAGWELPREDVYVLAAADGYGFAVARLRKPGAAPLTLRLVRDDVPIQGRVLDLQGKPVAGARVRVSDCQPLNMPPLYVPKKGDLTDWLAALKANVKDPWVVERAHLTGLYSFAFDLLFPPVTTGADGRFRMRGIGRERLVHLRVEGPTIATDVVNVMTRPGEIIRLPLSKRYPKGEAITYHGATFEMLAAPTKPVVGVVRDRDTGKPLAGVTITPSKVTNPFNVSNHHAGLIRTTTDKDGRYRLVGLPKGEDNQLLAMTDDLPYLPVSRTVVNTAGLGPVTVDFALKRGVWVKGRVTEKTTGKPLSGGVQYFCFRGNPHHKDIPLGFGGGLGGSTRDDGSFRFVVVPGRGLLAVQVRHNDCYVSAVGVEKIKVPRDRMGGAEYLETYPYLCYFGCYNALAEIAPKPGDESITCDLVVVPDPGRTRAGTVLGPDGKLLADAQATGARVDGAGFTADGLKPTERRLIQFVHDGKKLAGSLVVRGDEQGPLRVRLEPWGTLTGRVVTAAGEPLTGVRWVRCKTSKLRDASAVYDFDRTSPLGEDGRFRIEGLAPGLKYELQVSKLGYAVEITGGASKDLTIKAGETKGLGTLQVRVKE